ncbi:RagB/SusD family nutrient uptake outer membrane protein [Solitalea lacus]|uniref:RagB/SusD family nutrient uptake outer membrane protein n=1 Tax=Solitalea lacus TaxID=2911172 RepID=UPI001EDA2648|nr:RagB/SusD family nutrient uptake outer membrane protein [Solitalea lacus]UKJ06789.1 RagB/SusD family nutrient uptake outer membrane protein [Solitalea lacus]
MKTKIFVLSLLVSGIFSLTSCKTGLDLEPKDRISDVEMWQDQKLVSLYANNFYSQLRSGFNNTLLNGRLFSSITDDAMDPSTSSTSPRISFANPAYTATNSPLNGLWSSRYNYIRRANIFLSKIDEVPGDAQLNTRLKAEVRFLRAYYYYDLIQFFGEVPIITVAQDYDDESLFLPKNTLSECYDFIISELDLAAKDLPTVYPASDAGRITEQAAWAMKCRVQMLKQDWTNAAATAKAIMNLNVNRLLTDANPVKAYTDVFATKNNVEMILSVQHNDRFDELGTLFDKNTMSPYFGGLGYNCPTQNLVDEYEMKATGKPITDAASGFNAANPYSGRDPRFDATILYDDVTFKSRKMQMYTGGEDITVNALAGITSEKISPTGYYLRKFTSEAFNPNGDPNGRSSYNWPLIRYAEILLNYAEAQNEAVGPDESVRSALNLVRQRVGMPQVAQGLSQAQMRDVIRHERRIELAFEDFRYWDVKRWKLATTLFSNSTPIRKVTITKNPTTGVKTYAYSAFTTTQYSRAFLDKHYLFPIPQTEMDRPGNKLIQNKDW